VLSKITEVINVKALVLSAFGNFIHNKKRATLLRIALNNNFTSKTHGVIAP